MAGKESCICYQTFDGCHCKMRTVSLYKVTFHWLFEDQNNYLVSLNHLIYAMKNLLTESLKK